MLLQLIVLPYVMNLVLEQKDRKSTRLNSSHDQISYAVFCLKKKKKTKQKTAITQTKNRHDEIRPTDTTLANNAVVEIQTRAMIQSVVIRDPLLCRVDYMRS